MKLFAACATVLVAGLIATQGRTQEPTKADIDKANIRGEAVADLAVAADLVRFGRGDTVTGVKSPEALVSAGGILLRAHSTFSGDLKTLDVPATDAKGKPLPSTTEKGIGLDKQAEGLFDEARGMVAGDKVRAAALEDRIKEAKAIVPKPAVGGPKRITRILNGGETHTYPVAFFGGAPAAVAMTSSGPAKIQFDITHVGGTNLFSLRGHNATYTWTPPRDKDGARKFNITLTNMGNKPTTYTLITN